MHKVSEVLTSGFITHLKEPQALLYISLACPISQNNLSYI